MAHQSTVPFQAHNCWNPATPNARFKIFQGQKSAQGILRLRNPNLGPNSVKRILDARILDPNSWVEFFGSVFFRQKRAPEKFTLEKFTSQNSPSTIQPRNRTKKFTLPLCRAVWFKILFSCAPPHSVATCACLRSYTTPHAAECSSCGCSIWPLGLGASCAKSP